MVPWSHKVYPRICLAILMQNHSQELQSVSKDLFSNFGPMVIMINVDSKVVFEEKQLLRQNRKSLCARIGKCIHGSTSGSTKTVDSEWNHK